MSKTTIWAYEEHLARNVDKWPSQYHPELDMVEECKRIALYDWGNGDFQIRAHYYIPIYGVGDSMDKERWEEVRSLLGLTGLRKEASKLSDRMKGINVPEHFLEELRTLEEKIYG